MCLTGPVRMTYAHSKERYNLQHTFTDCTLCGEAPDRVAAPAARSRCLERALDKLVAKRGAAAHCLLLARHG
jgi:hypothetical protein